MDLLKNIPLSPRIRIAIVIAVMIIAASYLVNRPPSADKNKKVAGIPVSSVTIADIVNKDSDQDGIPDWEESLWGTDPDNPDTLGRGLGDKAEIEKRQATLGISAGAATNTPLTNTDILARQIFTTVASLGQAGMLDEKNLDIVTQSLGENIKKAVSPPAYTVSDLNTSVPDYSSRKIYAEEMVSVFKKYKDKKLGAELSDIVSAFQKDDQSAFDRAAESASTYKNFARDIIAIKVPLDIAIQHLSLANSYAAIGNALGQIKQSMADPVIGLVGMNEYQKESTNVVKSTQAIQFYLFSNGIMLIKQ